MWRRELNYCKTISSEDSESNGMFIFEYFLITLFEMLTKVTILGTREVGIWRWLRLRRGRRVSSI